MEESNREIEKCRGCPLNLEEYNDKKKADEYQCERKDAVQMDDGYFYCDGQSKLLYEVDYSYSIEETELK